MLFTITEFNMATGLVEDVTKDVLEREFSVWLEEHPNECMFLIEVNYCVVKTQHS